MNIKSYISKEKENIKKIYKLSKSIDNKIQYNEMKLDSISNDRIDLCYIDSVDNITSIFLSKTNMIITTSNNIDIHIIYSFIHYFSLFKLIMNNNSIVYLLKHKTQKLDFYSLLLKNVVKCFINKEAGIEINEFYYDYMNVSYTPIKISNRRIVNYLSNYTNATLYDLSLVNGNKIPCYIYEGEISNTLSFVSIDNKETFTYDITKDNILCLKAGKSKNVDNILKELLSVKKTKDDFLSKYLKSIIRIYNKNDTTKYVYIIFNNELKTDNISLSFIASEFINYILKCNEIKLVYVTERLLLV